MDYAFQLKYSVEQQILDRMEIISRLKMAKLPGCASLGYRTVNDLVQATFQALAANGLHADEYKYALPCPNTVYDRIARQALNGERETLKELQSAVIGTLLHTLDRETKYFAEQVCFTDVPIPRADKLELKEVLPRIKHKLTTTNKKLVNHSPTIVNAVLDIIVDDVIQDVLNKTGRGERGSGARSL